MCLYVSSGTLKLLSSSSSNDFFTGLHSLGCETENIMLYFCACCAPGMLRAGIVFGGICLCLCVCASVCTKSQKLLSEIDVTW